MHESMDPKSHPSNNCLVCVDLCQVLFGPKQMEQEGFHSALGEGLIPMGDTPLLVHLFKAAFLRAQFTVV